MEIQGAGGLNGPQPIYPRLAAFSIEAGASAPAAAPRDQVEISSLGLMMEGISRLPDIRHEKVEAIRQQIAAGTYETPDKLEKALDGLLSEMFTR
jgi:negative regulator of flagellin synthesis FlgM